MSIRTLAEAISRYGHGAYLLTVGKDGPHTSDVTVELCNGSISCQVGTSAARNIAGVPNVSLFWPPTERDGYALIVNGVAAGKAPSASEMTVDIAIMKSVLHRPGPKPADSDGPCASDCRRLAR